MTQRKYSSRSQQTTLTAPITSTAGTMAVVSGSALMGGKTLSGSQTYTVVIDPDTALEEIVDVKLYSSGNTLTIERNIDGSTGQAHSAGAVVRHMAIGRDYQEANDHIEASTSVHGITDTAALATLTGTQTLTNKTLTSPKINENVAVTATATELNILDGVTASTAELNLLDGVTATTTELNYVDGVTSAIQTQLDGKQTIVSGVSSTEIGYLDGVTSAIQTQLDAKAPLASPTFTGTVTLPSGTVTSAMILDGTIANADINTSAQIAYGKLALTNGIVNADINASAAIDWSKIAPSSTVSATELGYLDGVTSAIQTQLDAKLGTSTASSTYAPIASPTFTGVPAAPTATAGTNTTQVATTAFVNTAVNNLIDGAPSTLDTLNEIAAALADTANFSDTVVLKSGSTMSGALAMGTNKITGLGDPTSAQDAATKNYIDTVVLAPSNLTGPITSVGNVTSIASKTGTGTKFVVDTSPTLVTPDIGVATATSINGTTIPSSKTLVATDSTAYVVPSQTGNSGKYLTTDGTTSSWGTINGYSAPTLGTTSIASGATVSSIAALGLTNALLTSPREVITVSATAATGTIQYDILTQSVLYYTSNASANWTLNFRGNVSTSVNTLLSTGQSVTVTFLNTNGTTAYYPTAITIDGSAQTVKWSGGTAPAYGNASSIDAYQYTIIKTASATYTVLGVGPIKYA